MDTRNRRNHIMKRLEMLAYSDADPTPPRAFPFASGETTLFETKPTIIYAPRYVSRSCLAGRPVVFMLGPTELGHSESRRAIVDAIYDRVNPRTVFIVPEPECMEELDWTEFMKKHDYDQISWERYYMDCLPESKMIFVCHAPALVPWLGLAHKHRYLKDEENAMVTDTRRWDSVLSDGPLRCWMRPDRYDEARAKALKGMHLKAVYDEGVVLIPATVDRIVAGSLILAAQMHEISFAELETSVERMSKDVDEVDVGLEFVELLYRNIHADRSKFQMFLGFEEHSEQLEGINAYSRYVGYSVPIYTWPKGDKPSQEYLESIVKCTQGWNFTVTSLVKPAPGVSCGMVWHPPYKHYCA